MEELSQKLKQYYYDPKEHSSYQSNEVLFKRIKKDFPNIKREDVRKWLLDQESYSAFQRYEKFQKNPIISKSINHIWFADLIDVVESKPNKGIKHILMVIDNLSKFGHFRLLKRKKEENIYKAYKNIIENSGKPKILITDPGPEFTNKLFAKFNDENKIWHLILTKNQKAANVERWNQTIKRRINKYAQAHNTLKFIDVIYDIVNSYNNSVHSRTKYKPIDVNIHNQNRVFKNLFKMRIPLEKQSFEIGDRVHIPIQIDDKTRFAKKQKRRFQTEIFLIDKVLFTSPFYKYIVKNVNGIVQPKSFYAKELKKLNK